MISSALGGTSPQGSYCHASSPPILIATATSVNSHDIGSPSNRVTATTTPASIHTGAVMMRPAIRTHNTVPIADRVLANIFSKTTKKIISFRFVLALSQECAAKCRPTANGFCQLDIIQHYWLFAYTSITPSLAKSKNKSPCRSMGLIIDERNRQEAARQPQ